MSAQAVPCICSTNVRRIPSGVPSLVQTSSSRGTSESQQSEGSLHNDEALEDEEIPGYKARRTNANAVQGNGANVPGRTVASEFFLCFRGERGRREGKRERLGDKADAGECIIGLSARWDVRSWESHLAIAVTQRHGRIIRALSELRTHDRSSASDLGALGELQEKS